MQVVSAQELYVFSDPASNVPAKSVVVKGSSMLGTRTPLPQRFAPEVMAGLNKKVMLRAGGSFSNMHQRQVQPEAAYLYGKYRFLSNDDVHSHFRMAAFAEAGYSKNPLVYDELNIQGDVSGVQGGIIATQLVHKLAVSATASYIKAFREDSEHDEHMQRITQAFSYSLSAGRLILPAVYKNYDQLNLNLYTEVLGQKALDGKAWFVDIAPSIQFIFKSNTKLNLGFRHQLGGNANRFNKQVFVVSAEHTFFNALRRK